MEANKDSVLKMHDLYFSKFSFANKRNKGAEQIEIVHHARILESAEDKQTFKVELNTDINTKQGENILSLQTIGIFELVNGLDEGTVEYIKTRNTLAIMFPYVRTQVALLTTQPGMMPIMMQPINVNKLSVQAVKKED